MMQNLKPEIKLFVIVAIVAVVIAVGSIFLLRAGVSNQVTHTPSPQPQAISNEQSAIDTSDWQTYRNDEFGFEVKYPKGFAIADGDQSFIRRDGGSFGINISDKNNGTAALHVSVIETNLSPREWLDEHYTAIPANYNDVYAGHYSTPQDTIVNGVSALRFSLFFTSGSLQSTIIQKDSNVLYHIAAGSDSRGSFPQETYNQILSTFRFVDKKQTPVVTPAQTVSVATDKQEYKSGEIVRIRVLNGLQEAILIPPVSGYSNPIFAIQRKLEDGTWENVYPPPPPIAPPALDEYQKINSGNTLEYIWEKTEITSSHTFRAPISYVSENHAKQLGYPVKKGIYPGREDIVSIYSNEFRIIIE